MVKITYREFSGANHVVEVPAGQSVMEGAISNGVPGIDADCGGACACATCHIQIPDEWLGKVNVAGEAEMEMLELAQDPTANSRLSCQIQVTPELDGLVVLMPESQR